MAKSKYDGVIEAVHNKPDGKVDWVRAYLRRGPTFSDHLLLQRQTVIELLKSGKRLMTGRRVIRQASTFEVGEMVRMIEKNGKTILVVGDKQPDQDDFSSVPRI